MPPYYYYYEHNGDAPSSLILNLQFVEPTENRGLLHEIRALQFVQSFLHIAARADDERDLLLLEKESDNGFVVNTPRGALLALDDLAAFNRLPETCRLTQMHRQSPLITEILVAGSSALGLIAAFIQVYDKFTAVQNRNKKAALDRRKLEIKIEMEERERALDFIRRLRDNPNPNFDELRLFERLAKLPSDQIPTIDVLSVRDRE
jgi:hypothetical protein